MILIKCNYLVHRFFRGITFSLRLFDLFRVSPLLNNEVEYVEHFEILYGFSEAGVGSLEVLYLRRIDSEIVSLLVRCLQPWWGFLSVFHFQPQGSRNFDFGEESRVHINCLLHHTWGTGNCRPVCYYHQTPKSSDRL